MVPRGFQEDRRHLRSNSSLGKPWKNRQSCISPQEHAEDRSSLKQGEHHPWEVPPGRNLRAYGRHHCPTITKLSERREERWDDDERLRLRKIRLQRLLYATYWDPQGHFICLSPPDLWEQGAREPSAAPPPPSPSAHSYLLGSQQSGPPVHVILRFDHVHHLIGVQFEFTLQLVQALHVLHGLLTVSLLPFLLLLLPTTLTLTDPPQIPVNQRNPSWNLCSPFSTARLHIAGGSVLAPQKLRAQLLLG